MRRTGGIQGVLERAFVAGSRGQAAG